MTTEFVEKSEIREVTTGRFLPGHNIGRPRKGETYSEIAASLPTDLKRGHIMAQSDRALAGDTRAAEFLRDTAEGRPAQRVEVTDTTVADALRGEILQALAAAGAVKVIEGEWQEIENPS
jgi:hypothetical protein